jgi:hypothetical protein
MAPASDTAAYRTVAIVVDDLESRDPWTVRGLEIRGTAAARKTSTRHCRS